MRFSAHGPGAPHLVLIMGWGVGAEAFHGFDGNQGSLESAADTNDTEAEPELTESGLTLMRYAAYASVEI